MTDQRPLHGSPDSFNLWFQLEDWRTSFDVSQNFHYD